jgi:hypothetical protein
VWKAVWEDANEGLKSYPGNWDMLDGQVWELRIDGDGGRGLGR